MYLLSTLHVNPGCRPIIWVTRNYDPLMRTFWIRRAGSKKDLYFRERVTFLESGMPALQLRQMGRRTGFITIRKALLIRDGIARSICSRITGERTGVLISDVPYSPA